MRDEKLRWWGGVIPVLILVGFLWWGSAWHAHTPGRSRGQHASHQSADTAPYGRDALGNPLGPSGYDDGCDFVDPVYGC